MQCDSNAHLRSQAAEEKRKCKAFWEKKSDPASSWHELCSNRRIGKETAPPNGLSVHTSNKIEDRSEITKV